MFGTAAAVHLMHQCSHKVKLQLAANFCLVVIVQAAMECTPADCSMAARAPLVSPWAQKPLTPCRVACLLLKMLITVWCLAISCVISSVSDPMVLCPCKMTLQAGVHHIMHTRAHRHTRMNTHKHEHTHTQSDAVMHAQKLLDYTRRQHLCETQNP